MTWMLCLIAVLTIPQRVYAATKLNNSNTKITVSDVTYNGEKQTPEAKVKYNSTSLKQGTDFSVSYSNNKNAGTATVTVTGKGKYTGTVKGSFTIKRLSVAGKDFVCASISDKTYRGSEYKPVPTLKWKGTALSSSSDYSCSYEDNVNAGTGKVIMKGKGNFSGSKTATFKIKKRDFNDGVLLKSYEAVSWTGSPITNHFPVLKLSNYQLVAGKDYNYEFSHNINIGTAKIQVTGKGNFTGEASYNFMIQPCDLSNATVESAGGYVYTGKEVLLKGLKVKVNNRVLSRKSGSPDYQVEYSQNVNAGKATASIIGCNNYCGTKNYTYTIEQADISKVAYICDISKDELDSRGFPLNPQSVVVKMAIKTDSSQEESGENGNQQGGGTSDDEDDEDYDYEDEEDYDYEDEDTYGLDTEQEIEEPVINADEVMVLSKDQDYTVSYEKSENSAVLTVKGKGNFKGTLTKEFVSHSPNIKDCQIKVEEKNLVYTGMPQTPKVTVTLRGETLNENQDYSLSYSENIKVGTGQITVSGKGEYIDSQIVTFQISPYDISNANCNDSIQTYSYTGNAQSLLGFVVTHHFSGYSLTLDKDYKVSYYNNVNAGTASAILTGINQCTGTKTYQFTIVPADISKLCYICDFPQNMLDSEGFPKYPQKIMVCENGTATNYPDDGDTSTEDDSDDEDSGEDEGYGDDEFDEDEYETDGDFLQQQEVYEESVDTLGVNGVLTKDLDYEVSYEREKDVATLTVTGKGNYTGKLSKEFYGLAIDLSQCKININEPAHGYAYTGKEIKPKLYITYKELPLTENTDYQVTYSNNIEVSKVKVPTCIISGLGKYKGKVSKTFTIQPKNISKLTISGVKSSYPYQGKGIKPQPIIKDGSTVLKKTDYSVGYRNQDVPGTATIVVKGKGNYKGTLEKTYRIISSTKGVLKVKKTSATKLKISIQGNPKDVYCVEYASNKLFQNKKAVKVTKSRIVKIKKGKTYYLRINYGNKYGKIIKVK